MSKMTTTEIHSRIDDSTLRAGQHAARALLTLHPMERDSDLYREIHALLTDLAELSVLTHVLARMSDPAAEVA